VEGAKGRAACKNRPLFQVLKASAGKGSRGRDKKGMKMVSKSLKMDRKMLRPGCETV
jgi:hypothetical protein